MSWRGGSVKRLSEACLELVQKQHVEFHEPGIVEIVEQSEAGAGTVRLLTPDIALKILPDNDNHPIRWYCENKCADGAIILQTPHGFHVYVIELKSCLSTSQWAKARKQIRGMLINTLATMGALSLSEPIGVTCYIAMDSEKVGDFLSKSLGAKKRPVGIGKDHVDSNGQSLEDFRNNVITLPDGKAVPVAFIQRDAEGNASINLA